MAERAAWRRALAIGGLAVAALLAGCASGPRSGRDGAPSNPPADMSRVPDAEPRIETIRGSGGTSRPYTVLGRSYVPIADDRPFRESGLASWYGTKFHAQSTASGEPYDMYAMTAAHKTLPLPSYVRVRNPANGREAIVRVNDRGPFHDDRVIDLSYAAAARLDLLRGVAPVEIERITNDDIRTGAWRRPNDGTQLAQAQAPERVVSVPQAAPQSVAVPAAFTTPVVAAPRAEVNDLEPMVAAPAQPQAPEAPPGTSTAGYWVQLGAFSQRDGAIAFQQRVAKGMPELAPLINVFTESNTHRVQAGPYASRELARNTADQVRNGLQLVPLVVERR
ncbi:MAG: septal ring lytic transglycosylase RlpA family protein [Comamonadaceae bacterium]|nr:MAG: septal ring lytic transglycosylase RlpA family protein [Comamonadaceae bacterium]